MGKREPYPPLSVGSNNLKGKTMAYIYSTLTNDNEYRVYKKGGGDMPVVSARVLIKGGNGVANKNLITTRGTVTQVTDEELELLKTNKSFVKHMDGGFITIEAKKVKVEKVTKNMTKKDKSAPITPEDYSDKAPIVNKG